MLRRILTLLRDAIAALGLLFVAATIAVQIVLQFGEEAMNRLRNNDVPLSEIGWVLAGVALCAVCGAGIYVLVPRQPASRGRIIAANVSRVAGWLVTGFLVWGTADYLRKGAHRNPALEGVATIQARLRFLAEEEQIRYEAYRTFVLDTARTAWYERHGVTFVRADTAGWSATAHDGRTPSTCEISGTTKGYSRVSCAR